MEPFARLDHDALWWVVGHRQPWLTPVVQLITYSGFGHWQLAALLPFFFRRSSRPVAWLTLLAWVLAGLVNILVKEAIPRPRPSLLFEGLHLDQAVHSPSFPSGHTVTSFAMAFALLLALKGTRWSWVGWSTLVWASLVGYSRMYVGVHWPSDVLGGVVIGGLGAGLAMLVFEWRGWPPVASGKDDADPASN